MTLALFMDHHVHSAITRGLRARGIDVLTALEDGSNRLTDSELLDRALVVYRILFSQDDDLLQEAARRQQAGEPFAGLVYARQIIPKGTCIQDLEPLATVYSLEEMMNRVEYLPL